jgi:hypothetical protein
VWHHHSQLGWAGLHSRTAAAAVVYVLHVLRGPVVQDVVGLVRAAVLLLLLVSQLRQRGYSVVGLGSRYGFGGDAAMA